jgi:hypothetical protein
VEPICRIGRKTAKLPTVIKRPPDQDHDTAPRQWPFSYVQHVPLSASDARLALSWRGIRVRRLRRHPIDCRQCLPYTKATEVWNLLHAASLQRLQLSIQGNARRWLWGAVAVTILDAPAVLVLGVVGATLVLLGAQKKRLDKGL